MVQVGLCLPGSNGCHSGPFSAKSTATGPFWPGPDLPLGRQPLLGQMLFCNKKKNHLKKLLDSWPDASPTFSSHLAAVEAGLHFLNSYSKHPIGLSTGEFTSMCSWCCIPLCWNCFQQQQQQVRVHSSQFIVEYYNTVVLQYCWKYITLRITGQ